MQSGETNTPWLPLVHVEENAVAEQRLHNEIVAYTTYLQPTPQEIEARNRLFLQLQRIITRRWRNARVSLFGSTATGLCLPNADLDISVQDMPDTGNHLSSLASVIRHSNIGSSVQVHHRARVPIIRLVITPDYGSFSVDISVNNNDGNTSRNLVNKYLSEMPALRPLILVIKGALLQIGLNNPARNGIGSYGITCMCISFLQLNPGKRPNEFLDDPMQSKSLGYLLSDFMHYYGVLFPYTSSYISISEGKLISKDTSAWSDESPPGHLAIQCPIHLDNDICTSIGSIQMENMRQFFKTSYAHILQLKPGQQDSLGPIVTINQKTLDRRAYIRQLIDSKPPEILNSRSSGYDRGRGQYMPFTGTPIQGGMLTDLIDRAFESSNETASSSPKRRYK